MGGRRRRASAKILCCLFAKVRPWTFHVQSALLAELHGILTVHFREQQGCRGAASSCAGAVCLLSALSSGGVRVARHAPRMGGFEQRFFSKDGAALGGVDALELLDERLESVRGGRDLLESTEHFIVPWHA